jgi:hypothetical protein
VAHDTLTGAGAARAAPAAPAAPARELFLHVGLHKTATSYVQRMALENRALLLAHGLGLAPYQDPASGSHQPLVEALERDGPEAVFERIAAAPGAKLLVSAEDLAHLLADPARARAIRDAAARHFQVTVLIVLRRQDALKESVFGEAVKLFYSGSIEDERHYDYDHDRRLARLEAVFGPERVRVSVYSEAARNDVFGELMAAMGVALDRAALAEVAPQNVSMHRRKRLYLALVPKDRGVVAHPGRRAAMRAVRQAVEASAAIADDGVRTLMSPRQRQELLAAHAAGNRALVARHRLAPPPDFLAPPEEEAGWHPPRPLSGRELAGVSRDVLRACWRGRGPLAGARLAARVGPLVLVAAARALRRPLT